MGSLFSLLSVARDGLQAQSTGLAVTGQNISNINTPGYARRVVEMSARPVLGSSFGGVEATRVSRSFDRLSRGRVVEEHGRQGAADARASALSTLESIVAPGGSSISDSLDGFFRSLDTLSGSPSDTSARLSVLGRAGDLAQRISGAADDLSTLRSDLLQRATGVAGEVNERLGRIATLNSQIAESTARGDGGADLRDQRDQLVQEVGDRIGARAIEDDAGRVTLFAAGVALVDGSHASSLAVGTDLAGNLQVQVKGTGSFEVDVTNSVTQGTLGGIREARDTDAPAAAAALDRFAFDLAGAVNAVHSSGVGLDGTGGRSLFTTSSSVSGAARSLTLNAALDGHPERVAASGGVAGLPGGNDVALRLAGLASAGLGAGSATPSDRFASIVADVGVRHAAAESESALRADTVLQAESLRESASGVSLDEETINLTKFQRAFEASTRVLRTADELLDNLLKSL